MSKQRESFEDWWRKKGHLYQASMKEGIWLVFSDAWYRSEKAARVEQ